MLSRAGQTSRESQGCQGEAPTLPDSLSPTLSDLKSEARGTIGPLTQSAAGTQVAAETQVAVKSWTIYLQAPSINTVVATGGGLAKTAVKPAVWTANGTVAAATSAYGWVRSAAKRGLSGGAKPAPAPARQPASNHSSSLVELKLQSGQGYTIRMGPETTVAALREQVQAVSGLPPEQQVLVIAEDRARLPGLGRIAKRVQTSIQTTRQDVRSAVIAWVNFVFLPEAFNRELYGRGLISWAKGTSWFQSLQEAQRRAEAAAAAQCSSATTVKVQVEQLSGQVLLVEVELDARVAELKLAIQHRLGVLADQQRVIVLERHGPGRLTHLTNALLLHSLSGMKLALGAAAWAGTCLLSKPEASIPVAVRTNCNRVLHMSVVGDTSINQLRCMLRQSLGPDSQEELQEVRILGKLPPLQAEQPDSHIIKALAS